MLLNIRNPLKALDLPTSDRLKDSHIYHLMLIYVLITSPLLTVLPFWILGVAATIVTIKTFTVRKQLKIPKYVTFVLLVASTTTVIANIQSLGAEYTSLAMLFVFASLKLLETKLERDAFLLMLINMLLITGVLMAHKTGGVIFILMLVLFFYNIYIQLIIAQPKEIAADIKSNIKWLSKLALLAFPFVVLLFMFFPRIDPLWTAGLVKKQGQTGLSDTMSPGKISSLAKSEELAFRVKFNDELPHPNLLYWRGPILSNYDGETWYQTTSNNTPKTQLDYEAKSAISYELILTGETQGWVPALDVTILNNIKNLVQKETLDITQNPKKAAFKRGHFLSYTQFTMKGIDNYSRGLNTFLPQNSYPKIRMFAKKQFIKANKKPDVLITNILNYIQENEYGYFLESAPGSDDADKFWFEIKAGYCEHYANALTIILRSVGIPARVATGYQGGELNPVSGEFEVRQMNAHAWVEAYLDNKGWTRIDPTGAVSPERINTGRVQDAVEDNDNLSWTTKFRESSESFAQLINYLNASRAFWDNWVANFDDAKQRALLEKLGIDRSFRGAILMFGIILLLPVTLLLRWLWKYFRKRSETDEIQKAMNKFDKKLTKGNLKRQRHEPYESFFHNHAEKLETAKGILETYQKLRFYSHSLEKKKELIKKLKSDVKQYRVTS